MNIHLDEGGSELDQNPLDVQVFTQWTPNPNAFKFIASDFVIDQGKAGFQSVDECEQIPLVREILSLSGVSQVHLYENVITVTQDGSQDWGPLTEEVEEIIKTFLPAHDSNIVKVKGKSREGLSPEILQIEDILDRTIRPGLQGDGGDVEVLNLVDNVLTIRYEGACGTCPSSLAGTLQAITSFLRDEFNPDIEVVAV